MHCHEIRLYISQNTLVIQKYRETVLHDLEEMVFGPNLVPRGMTKRFACVVYEVRLDVIGCDVVLP